jgi:hypothetical protein
MEPIKLTLRYAYCFTCKAFNTYFYKSFLEDYVQDLGPATQSLAETYREVLLCSQCFGVLIQTRRDQRVV